MLMGLMIGGLHGPVPPRMLRAMSDVKREDGEAQEPSEETPPEGSESEGEETEASAEAEEAAAPSRQPRRPAKPVGPPTEEALNAPSRQTVGMLGVVAAATLIMWGAGRAACNYHEPGESLSPREVSLEARTRSPKDVALEFSHRWLTADFDIAAKLSTGDVAAAVAKDRASCSGDACAARKNAALTALSVAEAVQGNPVEGFIRVRTTGLPQGEVIKMYGVERVGQEWKVTRELDPAAPLPALKEPPVPTLPMGPGTELPPGAVPLAPPGASAPAVPAPGPQGAGPQGAASPKAPAPQPASAPTASPQGAAPKAAPAPTAPAPAAPAAPKP